MTLSEIETYCLAKAGAYLDWPFGPKYAVIKVKAPSREKGRIFAQPFILRGEPKVIVVSKLPKKARKKLEAARET